LEFVSLVESKAYTSLQMAKRMQYSVVGLPHYTIWHLYEPSADDLRHMEDMERERLEKEKEENEKQDRERKIAAEFDTSNEISRLWRTD
jgi:mannan polymerase II complex ANP1 subunit